MPFHYSKLKQSPIGRTAQTLWKVLGLTLPTNWLARRLVLASVLVVSISVAGMFGVATWYANSRPDKPATLGVSFIPAYARFLGVEPKETMDALLDINVRQFRLVSYWSEIESTQGTYDFTELDWQFAKAEAADAKISLAIGLRQPRWPECHVPDWARQQPVDQIRPELNAFMTAVVNRYKNSPSLESYQLENEFFNKFGQCTDFNRERLVAEYDLVKRLDPAHPVIVSKSSNTPVPSIGQPRPDTAGMSIYRRVWDGNLTKDYFTYPFPSWYYGFIAGIQLITTGTDSVIHELQMEPWPPQSKAIPEISLAEQQESFSANSFTDRVAFAERTGMKSIDLWGAEWWYWRKEVKQDQDYWNAAQTVFKR